MIIWKWGFIWRFSYVAVKVITHDQRGKWIWCFFGLCVCVSKVLFNYFVYVNINFSNSRALFPMFTASNKNRNALRSIYFLSRLNKVRQRPSNHFSFWSVTKMLKFLFNLLSFLYFCINCVHTWYKWSLGNTTCVLMRMMRSKVI